jgi:hypothetical protein
VNPVKIFLEMECFLSEKETTAYSYNPYYFPIPKIFLPFAKILGTT